MYGYDIFHEELAQSMIDNIRRGNPPHAYIFEGERGLGRYAFARLIAAALTCTGEREPCGVCSSCIGAAGGTNPDIVLAEPPEKRKTIGADSIREIITDAYVRPFLAKRKVYIFRDAKIMTEQAQNAFLKLLEEPPEYAVFIIIAENAEQLLQTIRSRCVIVRFSALSKDKLREYVKKTAPECANADFVVNYSRGIPYEAKKILTDESFDDIRLSALNQLPLLLSIRPLSAFELCDYADENKDNMPLIVAMWREFLRDIMLIQNGARNAVTNSDYIEKLSEYAQMTDEKIIIKLAGELINTEEMLRRYVSLRSAVLRLGFAAAFGNIK